MNCHPDPELVEGEGPAVRRQKQVIHFVQEGKTIKFLDLIVAIFDDSLQGFGSRLASARAFQLTHSLF
jgi:hypothetical protein